ncbi:MAG: PilN domain-containing protein [Chitinispirillaceae bacterium]
MTQSNPVRTEPKKGNFLTGVVPTEDGTFVSVTFRYRKGSYTPVSVKSWPITNSLKSTLLFSRGTVLGISSDWVGNSTENIGNLLFTDSDSVLKAGVQQQQCSIYIQALSGSLKGLVPDDAFLTTLPLAFCKNPDDSFVSVFIEGKTVRIGVTIKRKLEGVFEFPCSSSSDIQNSIKRIKRYWKYVLKKEDFPELVYTFDQTSPDTNYDGIPVTPVKLPGSIREGNVIKAAGAAFAAAHSSIPSFSFPSENSFSRLRPLALKYTLILLITALVLSSLVSILNYTSGRELERKEQVYNTFLKEDRDIRRLNETAEELSEKILSVKKTFSRMSNWGKLFQTFGDVKPPDLYLERLASDQISNSQKIRIVITGWSQSETSATEFISKLQSESFVKGASLSSMERDRKSKNICRFKIICTMDLYEN